MKKIIVIVDAYSTGKFLPFAFLSYGYPCIHVVTHKTLPPSRIKKFASENKNFIETISLNSESTEEIESVVQHLKQYDIKAVLPGSEPGVIIADMISQYLDIPKNNISFSLARRHKYHMINALAKAGLPTQQQTLTHQWADLLEWYEKNKLKKVVLKATMSSGGDHVYICDDLDEVKKYFQIILKGNNNYGAANLEVVAQEYIEGTQYIVNTVSLSGKHFVTDIWQECGSEKKDLLHDDYAELLNRDSETYSVLTHFANQVLATLEIQHGAAHHEIRLSPKGPRLIEVGARLAGNIDPSAVTEAIGHNHVSVTVEAIIDPASFERRANTNLKNRKYARYIYLCSEIEGEIKKKPVLDAFYQLPSLHSMNFVFEQGDILPRSDCANFRPGRAYLISDSFEQLEKDYREFRRLEKIFYNELLCH